MCSSEAAQLACGTMFILHYCTYIALRNSVNYLDDPIPSVNRVWTLSSVGMSSSHLSQGGTPTPLLRMLPSSCTCKTWAFLVRLHCVLC